MALSGAISESLLIATITCVRKKKDEGKYEGEGGLNEC